MKDLSKTRINILALPYKQILEVKGEKVFTMLGEYVMPYACSWVYSNLKEPFRSVTFQHEFMTHPSLRGSPFVEGRKLVCFNPSLQLEERKMEERIKEELEGLSIMEAILQARRGYLRSRSEFEVLCKSSTPYLVLLFVKIWDFLSEKASCKEKWDILYRLHFHSSCILYKDGGAVPPHIVLLKIMKKLEEKNPQKINLDMFSELFSEVLKEEGWIAVSPRHARVIYSLFWASILNSGIGSISKIALRNFLETAFWIPINACFIIDVNSFIAQRVRTIDMVLRFKPVGNSPLGEFDYRYAKNVKTIAKRMQGKPLEEERFLLYELPNIASAYIYELLKHWKVENPEYFSNDEWEAEIRKISFFRELHEIIPLRIYEFMNGYDRKTFENRIKELMPDALLYPEDCVNMIEKRAEKAYSKFGDLAEMLFDKDVIVICLPYFWTRPENANVLVRRLSYA